MALKKQPIIVTKKRTTDSIIEILSNFEITASDFEDDINIQNFVSNEYKKGFFISGDIDDNIEHFYGQTDDKENDLDWKIAKILFLTSILNCLYIYGYSAGVNEQWRDDLVDNVKMKMSEHFLEYTIKWPTHNWMESGEPKDMFATFESSDTKTIRDNLSDIDDEIADPIKELLKPLKTNVEIRGLIASIYGDFESIELNKYRKKLNESEWGLLNDTYRLAKRLVNDNKDKAKSHIGRVNLKVVDIAHNFSLLVSLVYKILNIASENINK